MTGRRVLSQRLLMELAESLILHPEDYDEVEPALRVGVQRAVAAFPYGEAGESVMMDLSNAYATLERNRAEDTTEEGVRPRRQSRTLLESGAVHESMAGLPQRSGGFSLGFEHRTDENGEPLHVWDEVNQRWIPNNTKKQ